MGKKKSKDGAPESFSQAFEYGGDAVEVYAESERTLRKIMGALGVDCDPVGHAVDGAEIPVAEESTSDE